MKPPWPLSLAILLAAGAASPVSVLAAEPTAQPAQDAIGTLGRFPSAVENALAQISKIPLAGTRRVAYKCGFDCLGALCIHELTFQCTFNFDHVQRSLQDRVVTVQRATWDFANGFMPALRTWSKTALPQPGAAFDQAAARLQTVQDEIARGAGSSDAHRAEVLAALDKLQVALNTGRQQLTQISQALAGHLERQRNAQRSLADWSASTRSEVERTAGKIRGEMNKQRCQGDGPQQVALIVAQMNGSIATITASSNQIQNLGMEADKALATLLGTFVTFSSRYEAVSDRLKVAKDAPVGSIIQDLHLKIARQSWQDLVDVAVKSGL